MHDIGDTLGSFNHPDIAAAILKPFVSDENLCTLQNQGIFQGWNFFHHFGMSRDMFSGHPSDDLNGEFVAPHDNPAFDPAAQALPISHFEPMVQRLMATPRNSVYKAAMDTGDCRA